MATMRPRADSPSYLITVSKTLGTFSSPQPVLDPDDGTRHGLRFAKWQEFIHHELSLSAIRFLDTTLASINHIGKLLGI